MHLKISGFVLDEKLQKNASKAIFLNKEKKNKKQNVLFFDKCSISLSNKYLFKKRQILEDTNPNYLDFFLL